MSSSTRQQQQQQQGRSNNDLDRTCHAASMLDHSSFIYEDIDEITVESEYITIEDGLSIIYELDNEDDASTVASIATIATIKSRLDQQHEEDDDRSPTSVLQSIVQQEHKTSLQPPPIPSCIDCTPKAGNLRKRLDQQSTIPSYEEAPPFVPLKEDDDEYTLISCEDDESLVSYDSFYVEEEIITECKVDRAYTPSLPIRCNTLRVDHRPQRNNRLCTIIS